MESWITNAFNYDKLGRVEVILPISEMQVNFTVIIAEFDNNKATNNCYRKTCG